MGGNAPEQKQITLRQYQPGRTAVEGYESPYDTPGGYSGWDYGMYNYGSDFEDKRREFIDKILKDNPGLYYSGKDDRFIKNEERHYRPGYQKVTGEDSMDDYEGQAYTGIARKEAHDMNAAYQAFLQGNVKPTGQEDDPAASDEEAPPTLLDYTGNDPGVLRYDPNQMLQDAGYLQSQAQNPQFQNARPQFDFSMLAQPYGQIATPSINMSPLQARALGMPQGAQVSPNQMRQTSRLKNLALQNMGYRR